MAKLTQLAGGMFMEIAVTILLLVVLDGCSEEKYASKSPTPYTGQQVDSGRVGGSVSYHY